MTKEEVIEMVKKYPLDKVIEPDSEPWMSQYDEISALINYAFVRERKPKVVLEFGAMGGRCTRDILRALLDNGDEFTFRSYELEDDNRAKAQTNLNNEFGDKSIILGGDVTKAQDIPDNIEYLFVDNYHDDKTTEWVFEYLIPKKCKPGALIHFHDMQITGDDEFAIGVSNDWGEMKVMKDLKDAKKLPLKKVFYSWEHVALWMSKEQDGKLFKELKGSSAWWTYQV